jgi:hypothetical protein
MEDTNASYTFRVNDKHIYLKLLAICVFEFLLLLIIVFILWLVTFEHYGNFFLFLGVSFLIFLPILTYYFLKRKSSKEVTVMLSGTEMTVQWPLKKVVIAYADIKSYSACRLHQDTGDVESVRISLKSGKKIALFATFGFCDIEPLREFREAFDKLAQSLKLPHELSWDEKLLKKN